MRSDIRWIRNRVSSLVDNLADQRNAAAAAGINVSPAATAHGLPHNSVFVDTLACLMGYCLDCLYVFDRAAG